MSNKQFKLDLNSTNVITCAVYAVIGLLLIILQGGSLGILMTVIGVLLIALGIVDVVKKQDLVKGIIELVIGVAVIVLGWIIADIVLLVFGILLIVKGILEMIEFARFGFSAMLSPIVTVVIGVLLVVSKWTLLNVICIVAGIIFIVNAILALFGKSFVKAPVVKNAHISCDIDAKVEIEEDEKNDN